VFGLVAVIAWSNRAAVVEGVGLLPRASPSWLLAAVAAIGLVYLCRATVYGIPLRLLDYTVPWTFLWQAAIIASAVNQLLPSAGASSYAFLAYALHRRGVATGQASLIAIIDTLSYACAAATLVVTALVYLSLTGGVPGRSLLVGFGPGVAAAALGGLVYWLQRDPRRFVPLVLDLQRRVGARLGRAWPDTPTRAFLDEYYRGKAVISRRPRLFGRMVLLQHVAVGADSAALYLTLGSLGLHLPPALVFLGFIVTQAAGTVVNAPAGGGSFEVVMSTFLAGQGVGPAQAIAGALLFRLVSFWIPALVSGVLVLNFRRRTREIQRRRPPR
jgi:putative heme transporter